MDNQLWYSKYRPVSLDDYIWSSEEFSQKIRSWINDRTLPNMILAGPAGIGKTTLAMLIPKEMGVESEDIKFINASDKNGIANIRYDIVNFCEGGGWNGIKIVILDEAERLTKDAQQALRGVMNEYVNVARFIFTCNEIGGITSALKSRARVITCDTLDDEQTLLFLLNIASSEGVDIENEEQIGIVLDIMSRYAPDIRKCIDIMQDSFYDGKLHKEVDKTEAVEWKDQILSLFESPKSVKEIRKVLSLVRDDEISSVYDWLCSNSAVISKKREKDVVITIANHVFRHEMVALQRINFESCIIQLTQINE